MTEYIDRQAVLDAIPQANEDKKVSLFGAVADFIVLVNEIPAADVAPVVHAHWEMKPVDTTPGTYHLKKAFCSNCGKPNKQYRPPYCPHCGAKMDEEANDGR